MSMISDLIVNIFFILLPIFLYHLFSARVKISKSKRMIIIGVASACSIVLCMTFTVSTIAEGHRFDLRQIPLLISGIYGNLPILLVNYFILVGYRILIGGEGIFVATTTNFLLVSIVIISLFFIKLNSAKIRIYFSIGLAILGMMINYFIYAFFFAEQLFPQVVFLFDLLLFQGIGMWMTVYIIETYQTNINLSQDLQRAEKLKSVSELAASISHEVRNPLTVVKGFIQLLNQKTQTPEKQEAYLTICMQELDRAESIIKDYLNYARPQVGSNVFFRVREQLEAVMNTIEPYALRHDVEMSKSLIEDACIAGEPNLFRQCVINILKNGIEAVKDQGHIEIRTFIDNNYIAVSIQDNGIGMEPRQLSRLGQPYFSTKETGTGLGLMVTYSGIHALKGMIDVQSQQGSGTRFILKFPMREQRQRNV